MDEKNEEQSKSEQEQPLPESRLSREQYEMLLRCSEKKDTTEWNQWRKHNDRNDILLNGARLKGAYLEGANLKGAHLEGADLSDAYLKGVDLSTAHLEGAHLRRTHLEGSYLYHTHLEGAYLYDAHLEGADLSNCHLENAALVQCHLEDASLSSAHMTGANFLRAHLDHANLCYTHLEDANFKYAHLERAFLVNAHLENSNFEQTIVDGSTLFWACHVDRNTNFSGVSLDCVRIDPGTKQLIEYNIRRMNWEQWYKEHPRLRLPVKGFWQISDYGLSTQQIIKVFFKLVILFAAIYYAWGSIDYYLMDNKNYPGLVSNLFVDRHGMTVVWWLVPLRTLYFSIVTMTTLGFGDIYANAQSLWGHILLSIQVILGYVLLGALVTRFAVLFIAGGPAASFSKSRVEKDTGTGKNRNTKDKSRT
ncbi:MAG: pentapeptide repeat-containing protein [Planctomycetota bacterium]|jgi:uncharacterized protein YjbI with pentapeptide repeats